MNQNINLNDTEELNDNLIEGEFIVEDENEFITNKDNNPKFTNGIDINEDEDGENQSDINEDEDDQNLKEQENENEDGENQSDINLDDIETIM